MSQKNVFIAPLMELEEIICEDILTTSLFNFGNFDDEEQIIPWE